MAITNCPRLRRLESPSDAAGSVTGGIDPDQSEIGVGIVADHAGGEAAALDGVDLDPGGAVDDMAVGEHQSVRRDHDAGPGSALPAVVGALEDVEANHGWDRRGRPRR